MSVKSTEFRKDNFKGYWKEEENHRVLKTSYFCGQSSLSIFHLWSVMWQNLCQKTFCQGNKISLCWQSMIWISNRWDFFLMCAEWSCHNYFLHITAGLQTSSLRGRGFCLRSVLQSIFSFSTCLNKIVMCHKWCKVGI